MTSSRLDGLGFFRVGSVDYTLKNSEKKLQIAKAEVEKVKTKSSSTINFIQMKWYINDKKKKGKR